ncbi:MAG: trehalose-phosphatase [Candidatus Schekmanbacteria bacterium]|nr:MAG: trehalose-phosphatase [Candidatus Schekmanbacteria bacterium]
MKYLFFALDEIKRKMKKKNIFLFLDYDGTLSPIVDSPDKAILPNETKETIQKLSNLKDFGIAIISGRAINDIKKRVGIKKIIYAGNHGFEIAGIKKKPKIGGLEKFKKTLKKIKKTLNEKVGKIEGVIIECKGISLTFHYRMVNDKDVRYAKKIFKKIVNKYVDNEEVRLKGGKKVIEIRPPVDWDKGKAVLFILNAIENKFKRKFYPIYIGDDKTDEDAFKVLNKKGLCIRIGRSKKTFANYYLKNTAETVKFLERLITFKEA